MALRTGLGVGATPNPAANQVAPSPGSPVMGAAAGGSMGDFGSAGSAECGSCQMAQGESPAPNWFGPELCPPDAVCPLDGGFSFDPSAGPLDDYWPWRVVE